MSNIRRDARLVPVPASVRKHVTTLVRRHGPREAGRRLHISRDAAVGIAAGLEVMPGTLALVRESMAKGGAAR